MKQSDAELAFDAAIAKEGDAGTRLTLARDYLERYPEDIPLVQTAAEVVKQSRGNPADATAEMRTYADKHFRLIGPQYAYALVAEDTLIWDAKARWALAKDSTSCWAWLMWTAAEWYKSKPDSNLVFKRIARAIKLDPSRPEGYLNLGDWYALQGKWTDATEAYQAGLVCDPENNYLRLRIEDIKDRLKKAGNPEPETK
jgi:tetratricopeptide (TPR) repeat protein